VDRLTLSSTLVLASEEIRPVHELYVRESKTVLDTAFHAVKFRIPGTGSQSLSVEPVFWFPIFSGIPDSTSKIFLDCGILDSFQYMGRHFGKLHHSL